MSNEIKHEGQDVGSNSLLGWQPIKTAPKDGTWFLALPVDYVRPTACRWWAPEWDPAGKWCLDAEWRLADMGEGALWTAMPPMPNASLTGGAAVRLKR